MNERDLLTGGILAATPAAVAIGIALAAVVWAVHTRIAGVLARRRARQPEPVPFVGFDEADANPVVYLICEPCAQWNAPHEPLGDNAARCFTCGNVRTTTDITRGD